MDDRFKGLLQCYSAFRDILLTVNDDVLDSMLSEMHKLREKVEIIEDTQKLQRHALEKSQKRQAKQVHKMESGIRIEGPKETQDAEDFSVRHAENAFEARGTTCDSKKRFF